MTYNPASCEIGLKYEYQLFNTIGAQPAGWAFDINDPTNLLYDFRAEGFVVWATTLGGLYFGQVARLISTADFSGIDFTKVWTCEFGIKAGLQGLIRIKGLSGWTSSSFGLDNRGTTVGIYTPNGLAQYTPSYAPEGEAVFRIEKYEVGALGKYRLYVNNILIEDVAPHAGVPWGNGSSIYTETGRYSTAPDFEETIVRFIHLTHEDLSNNCEGLISASASVDRGIAPLGVQFTDTSTVV